MALSTKDADIYIRILVDDVVVAPGTTNGIYMVDSVVGSGSGGEGGVGLSTRASRSDKICWRVELVNPNSSGYAIINEIGNSGAWGTTGQPNVATDITDKTAYVGIAEVAGTFSYNVSLDVVASTGQVATVHFAPTVAVS